MFSNSILDDKSSGIVVLNHQHKVRTYNKNFSNIFNIDDKKKITLVLKKLFKLKFNANKVTLASRVQAVISTKSFARLKFLRIKSCIYTIEIFNYKNSFYCIKLNNVNKYFKLIDENNKLGIYAELIKNLDIGVWSWGVDNNEVEQDFFSQNILFTKNKPPTEIKNLFDSAVYHEDSKDYQKFLTNCIENKEGSLDKFRIVGKDGTPFYISTFAKLFISKLNNLRYVVGISKSINNIGFSNKRSQTTPMLILDDITDGWWHFDLLEKRIYLSKKCKLILGVNHNEGIKLNALKEFISEDNYKKIKKAYHLHINNNKDFNIIVKFNTKNKKDFWVMVRGKILNNSRGEISGMLGICTDINEMKYMENYLESMVNFDILTKLPNRKHLMQELTDKLNKNKKVAVGFLDIDNFKDINDDLGHYIGDEVLKHVANNLNSNRRSKDFIARFGGDEFALIINEVNYLFEIKGILQSYLESTNKVITINGKAIQVSCSIGFVHNLDRRASAEELLKMADIAMYKAKNAGKGKFLEFTREVESATKREFKILGELKNVVNNNELSLLYQPQYSISNKKMYGVESLLRWNSPKLGRVRPDEFIKVAESRNQIFNIGNWVLEQVLSNFRTIHDKIPSLKISINISSIQLQDSKFEVYVKKIIARLGINPNNLIFEITETAVINNLVRTEKIILSLSKLGIKFSLDDFGTGYSSLNLLRNLPLYSIKIDKTFIKDLQNVDADRVIVESIINFSNRLDIICIAEGVESLKQLDILNELGCDIVQGYYLSPPLKLTEVLSKGAQSILAEELV